jgi:hypothetical protein
MLQVQHHLCSGNPIEAGGPLRGGTGNVFNRKRLVPLVLSGEIDEVVMMMTGRRGEYG